MKVPTTALMSVVLVLTSLSVISRPTIDVNVINFPLDEQGNLKTSYIPTSKVQTLIRNANVSWSEGTGHIGKNLDVVDVDGYDEIVFYISFKNWTQDVHYFFTVHFIVDGISVYRYGGADGDLWIPYTTPHNNSACHRVIGTECLLTIHVNVSFPRPAGWFLVDVSVYLRN